MFDWDKTDDIPTSELVEYMGWKDKGDAETEELARKCFEVFFDRFKVDLTHKCEILCRRWKHPPAVAWLLVERTFKKFLNHGHFDFEKSKAEDYDIGIRLYLYRIAQHELTDYYRETSGLRQTKYTGEEDLVYEVDELDVFKDKPESYGKLKQKLELLEHALDGVNEKHKLCYLTYINAGIMKGELPPRHLTAKLRDATGLTQVSIRVAVNRVRERVELITKIYAKKK